MTDELQVKEKKPGVCVYPEKYCKDCPLSTFNKR
jgi:hypothetical protein